MKPLIGETLRADGLLSQDQLRIALQEQAKTSEPIGKLLLSLGFITESALRDALAVHLDTPGIDLRQISIAPEVL